MLRNDLSVGGPGNNLSFSEEKKTCLSEIQPNPCFTKVHTSGIIVWGDNL